MTLTAGAKLTSCAYPSLKVVYFDLESSTVLLSKRPNIDLQQSVKPSFRLSADDAMRFSALLAV
jgi:hypothetical protein